MATDEKTSMKSLLFAKVSRACTLVVLGTCVLLSGSVRASGQAVQPAPAAAPVAGVSAPPGYVIGQDDALTVVFWREKELSADVIVRPDGMISLPLINDVKAEGLTPDQLRVALTGAAAKFVEEPTVTVVVRAINSRKVFITGQVGKPGPYPLNGPTTVLQLLAIAGGVAEYAKKEEIVTVRKEAGKDVFLPFNYNDVIKGKKLQQNIELKPGDTVVVP